MPAPKLTDEQLRERAERARADGADTVAKIRKRTGASEARIRRVLGEDPSPGGKTPSVIEWDRVEAGIHFAGTLGHGLLEARCSHEHADGSPSCADVYGACRTGAEKEALEYARSHPKFAEAMKNLTLPGGFGGVLFHFAPLARSVMRAHVIPGLQRRRTAQEWEPSADEQPGADEHEEFAPDVAPVGG